MVHAGGTAPQDDGPWVAAGGLAAGARAEEALVLATQALIAGPCLLVCRKRGRVQLLGCVGIRLLLPLLVRRQPAAPRLGTCKHAAGPLRASSYQQRLHPQGLLQPLAAARAGPVSGNWQRGSAVQCSYSSRPALVISGHFTSWAACEIESRARLLSAKVMDELTRGVRSKATGAACSELRALPNQSTDGELLSLPGWTQTTFGRQK